MKAPVKKQKKSKENKELKDALCDIVNRLDGLNKVDKKLGELVEYCRSDKKSVDFKENY